MPNRRQDLHCRRETAWMAVKLLVAVSAVVIGTFLFSEGCATAGIRPNARDYLAPRKVKIVTTGYCNCRKCCSWRYTWYGRPVMADGRPKKVGVTASGTRARRGTVAADTSVLPFGTIVEVPGYGYGRVEDRGGAIKGQRLDLWFPRHKEALAWGRKEVTVTVWQPRKK